MGLLAVGMVVYIHNEFFTLPREASKRRFAG